MKSTLQNCLQTIEEESTELWQGHEIDIEAISGAIHSASRIILDITEKLSDEDKLTTINYIKSGLKSFEDACNARDDYMLADCLYYQWREIITIYRDVLEG